MWNWTTHFRTSTLCVLGVFMLGEFLPATLPAEEPIKGQASVAERQPAVHLTDRQWSRLDTAVDSGLQFLSTQQLSDGSFASMSEGQPAVTSFCVMAFLSRGYTPSRGPYSEVLSRAIDYVVSSQQSSGLLYAETAYTENWKLRGSYNHAIAGVMLGEVYGMTENRQHESVRIAITNALRFTRKEQAQRKRWDDDKGGWRYLMPSIAVDSDLSVTAWHLMFYRSARNAEFDVPDSHVNEAVAYVEKCYDPQRHSFMYGLRGRGRNFFSRGMAGAGIVSLALAGKHDSERVKGAARFILEHPFDRFNRGGLTEEDRFYYAAFYCSQAMLQMGGEYFANFYPVLLDTMTQNQNSNGSWDLEANQDGVLGYPYSTSLAILSLTPPYQLLPIYQR